MSFLRNLFSKPPISDEEREQAKKIFFEYRCNEFNSAIGAVQVCLLEAHSPNLPPRFTQAVFYASAFFHSDGITPPEPAPQCP